MDFSVDSLRTGLPAQSTRNRNVETANSHGLHFENELGSIEKAASVQIPLKTQPNGQPQLAAQNNNPGNLMSPVSPERRGVYPDLPILFGRLNGRD
jgi:hypothetical protein